MAIMKTVLEVSMNDEKGKKKFLQAVAKLQGINQVSVDAERGRLTIIGEVDPVLLTKQVRKVGNYAKMISVGPPKQIVQYDKTDQSSCYYYSNEYSYPPTSTIESEMVVIGYPVYDTGYDRCNIV